VLPDTGHGAQGLGVVVSPLIALMQYQETIQAMDQLGVIEDGKLKPVFEALDEQYDYGVLKCVLAGMVGVY